jgi:hypothetical protein
MLLYIQRLFLSALTLIMLTACSNSEEPAGKDRIEQTTDKIAKEAVAAIKAPIDQAKTAKQLTDQHNDSVKKNVNQVEK